MSSWKRKLFLASLVCLAGWGIPGGGAGAAEPALIRTSQRTAQTPTFVSGPGTVLPGHSALISHQPAVGAGFGMHGGPVVTGQGLHVAPLVTDPCLHGSPLMTGQCLPDDHACAAPHPPACDGRARPLDWYVSLSSGWVNRQRVHERATDATFLTFDDGFVLNGALGRRFGPIRAETELSLFNNSINIAGAGLPVFGPGGPGVGPPLGFVAVQSPAEGNVTLRAYMFNLYYDVIMADSRLRPYVGAGIGFYQSEINGLLPAFFATSPEAAALGITPQTGVNATSDFPFAYQFRAGLGYLLTERTEVFGGYRFFRGDTLRFAAIPFGVFEPRGAEMHSVEFGFRVNF